MTRRRYKVAGHLFSIGDYTGQMSLWNRMQENYAPFEVAEAGSEIFSLSIVDEVRVDVVRPVYSNREKVEPGYVVMDVHESACGYCFELTYPGSECVNARLDINLATGASQLSLSGEDLPVWYTFNTAVQLCFMTTGACRGLLLTHSSVVVHEGKAYLFLGKSGTGKSTHSRMWLSAFEDAVLMNDDHPVLRLTDGGEVIAYGSPWSGKTRCYKNMQALVGAIVRIVRAGHNKAVRLNPIHGYASLMTACSGITWDRSLADGRDSAMQGIVSRVPCWNMECLPEAEAARVCHSAVAGETEYEGV